MGPSAASPAAAVLPRLRLRTLRRLPAAGVPASGTVPCSPGSCRVPAISRARASEASADTPGAAVSPAAPRARARRRRRRLARPAWVLSASAGASSGDSGSAMTAPASRVSSRTAWSTVSGRDRPRGRRVLGLRPVGDSSAAGRSPAGSAGRATGATSGSAADSCGADSGAGAVARRCVRGGRVVRVRGGSGAPGTSVRSTATATGVSGPVTSVVTARLRRLRTGAASGVVRGSSVIPRPRPHRHAAQAVRAVPRSPCRQASVRRSRRWTRPGTSWTR